VILEKKNVIVAEVVAQAKDKEFEKTLEEKRNLLDACHAVCKDLKTAHSSLLEQIIELERKLDRFLFNKTTLH
jgi:septal ring factor EnvC (AmiA/AmiB activator)